MMIVSARGLLEGAVFFAIRHERLQATSTGAFNVLAGVASWGRPLSTEAARAACCTAPFGGTYCGSNFCTGSACGGTYSCIYVTDYCPSGTACWTSSCGGCTCCDCLCTEPPPFNGQFYCYCTNC